MLRVPKRGWMPPSRNSSPRSSPSRAAVLARPSGPAAYETWSKRMASILTIRASGADTGVALGPSVGVAGTVVTATLSRRRAVRSGLVANVTAGVHWQHRQQERCRHDDQAGLAGHRSP